MSRCIVDNDTSDMCPQFHTSISLAGVYFYVCVILVFKCSRFRKISSVPCRYAYLK